jgi:hypothetical protein
MTEEMRQETTETTTTEETTEPSLNSQAKDLPWVKELQKKAAKLQRLEEELETGKLRAGEAAKAAEIKKAEDEKRYEDALKLKDEEAASKIAALEKKALKAELSTALLGKGAKNSDGFFKVALAEYDSEKHESIEAYADSLKETYAEFFTDGRTPLTPPGRPPATIGSGTLTNEQIRALKTSDKREDRAKAVTYLEDYYDKNGKFPDGYVTGR